MCLLFSRFWNSTFNIMLNESNIEIVLHLPSSSLDVELAWCLSCVYLCFHSTAFDRRTDGLIWCNKIWLAQQTKTDKIHLSQCQDLFIDGCLLSLWLGINKCERESIYPTQAHFILFLFLLPCFVLPFPTFLLMRMPI